jgi:hypothetical protein
MQTMLSIAPVLWSGCFAVLFSTSVTKSLGVGRIGSGVVAWDRDSKLVAPLLQQSLPLPDVAPPGQLQSAFFLLGNIVN